VFARTSFLAVRETVRERERASERERARASERESARERERERESERERERESERESERERAKLARTIMITNALTPVQGGNALDTQPLRCFVMLVQTLVGKRAAHQKHAHPRTASDVAGIHVCASTYRNSHRNPG
jgi:hypothetical protein